MEQQKIGKPTQRIGLLKPPHESTIPTQASGTVLNVSHCMFS
ncbi:hypothetical protein [Treponema socranskii]